MYTKFVHRTVLITLLVLAYPAASFAGFVGVGVTVGFGPLSVYVQPRGKPISTLQYQVQESVPLRIEDPVGSGRISRRDH